MVPHAPEKSIGAEETFASDIDDPELIRRELLRLSERTARSLRSSGCVARTVVVKLRLANFTTITRSRTLAEPTDVARTIHETACALYAAAGLDRARLRLVGVRATGLVPAAAAVTQLALGERPAPGATPSGRWTRSPVSSGPARCVPPPWSPASRTG